MKKLKLNWSQYHKEVDKLALQIKKSGKVYKAVYSPDNPMLAFLLSKKLGIELHRHPESMKSILKMTYIDKEFLKCMEPESTLIVSDIINTGKTREQYKDFPFACLHTKKQVDEGFIDYFFKNGTFWVDEIDKDTKVLYPYEDKKQLPWEKEIK